ncbi:MAG: hypothetical protein R3E77_07020 [Steroidobacteraceae bacterium]
MRQVTLVGLLSALAGFIVPEVAAAAGAAAGTVIDNTAQVSYTVSGTPVTTPSNTVSVTVAEILDVVVTAQTPVVNVTPGATQQVLVFRVTNTGNGQEAFSLALDSVLGGDNFDPVPSAPLPAIYFDTDGSGTWTPADVLYAPGSNEPLLNADGFATIFVVNGIPAGLNNGDRGLSQLTARSLTGTGAPGTVFGGQGTGGTDAVVGTTGADGSDQGEYLVSDVLVNAVKSQTVVDQFGGTRPIPGARINYSIAVNVTGSGTATAAAFVDNIPVNTTYVPNSLQLNGAPLTDATDADAGQFVPSPQALVRVTLGNLTQASATQTIQFSVTIN